MIKQHIFFTALLLSTILGFGCRQQLAVPDAQQTAALSEATAAYTSKDYPTAVHLLNDLDADLPNNAAVLYNLGNAYFRQDVLPLAILNYEKAIFLKSDFQEAKDNLLLAKSKLPGQMTRPNPTFTNRLINGLTAPSIINVWSVAAVLFFTIALALLFRTKLSRKFRLMGGIVFASFTIVSLLLAIISFHRHYHIRHAVVMVPVSLFEDKAHSNRTTDLPAGLTIRIHDLQGSEANVCLPDGRFGFVDVGKIAFVN